MRKQPDVKLAAIIDAHRAKGEQSAGTVTWTRKYKLITPLFGGGVSPAECDPVTIIRGTEIRAHLRFWWRATRGGSCSTVEKLREKEGAIWGKAAVKGEPAPTHEEILQIQVEVLEKGTIVGPKFPPSYVAFPLQQVPNAKLPLNVVFQLTISFPEKWQDDVKAALWAWETFGGIGARTRRGFGAICCTDALPGIKPLTKLKNKLTIAEIQGWIKGNLEAFIGAEDKFPDNVPHLSRHLRPALIPPPINKEHKRQNSYVEQQKPPTIKDAWFELVKRLKSFRQPMDEQGRWPDGENARKIASDGSPSERTRFPKANIGLPIVFQDKDDDSITLKGAEEGKDRFASPLILRPALFLQEPVGIALLLEGTSIHSGPLQLTKGGKTYPDRSSPLTHPKHTTLTRKDAARIAPLKGSNKDSLGKAEILDALFSRYENKHGGTTK